MAQEINKVYFGRGEYALSNANIDRVSKALATYNESGKWQWACQDVLGVKMDGSIGKRFGEIQAALATQEDDPKAVALLGIMSETAVRAPETITRTTRVDSAERQARQAAVKEILSTVEGLTEAEVARMAKAV